MKITDAKVLVCSPGRNFVTLKIYTDQGIYGLGDATLNGRELAVAAYLNDHLSPCLIDVIHFRRKTCGSTCIAARIGDAVQSP